LASVHGNCWAPTKIGLSAIIAAFTLVVYSGVGSKSTMGGQQQSMTREWQKHKLIKKKKTI
jgi:hypothetical protein